MTFQNTEPDVTEQLLDMDALRAHADAYAAGNRWLSCETNQSDIEYHRTTKQAERRRYERHGVPEGWTDRAWSDGSGAGIDALAAEIVFQLFDAAPPRLTKSQLIAIGRACIAYAKACEVMK